MIRLLTGGGDIMKKRISALMDGELEVHEHDEMFRALRRDDELRSVWSDYQLVGSALRNEIGTETDITARVMAALAEEPTVLAPRSRRAVELVQPLAALAASICGVGVVAWLALAPSSGSMSLAPSGLAARAPATTVAQASLASLPSSAVSQVSPRMEEYLVAHRAYSTGGAMVTGARNIRTVALDREGR